jgi:hypothetical protein
VAKFDALTKARTAAENAAAKAGELREKAAQQAEQAKNLAADMREQASSRVGDLKERVSGKVAEIKDAAVAGIKDLADDLNAHLPALREAGYTLTHVALEIGISPKVKASFAAAPDISQERVDAVIEEHKEARATVAMLRALYGAYKLQNAIRIAGMKPCDIELEIGVTPAAIIRFA